MDSATLQQLEAAAAHGDVERIAALLQSNAVPLPNPLIQTLAAVCMRSQRWDIAAAVLARSDDPAWQMQRCAALNLSAIQTHRPAVYRILMCGAGAQYSIAPAAGGRPTIVQHRPGGQSFRLSRGDNPIASARATLDHLKQSGHESKALAIMGIGDGYVLHALAHHPPKLLFDRRPPIYLVEPDAQLILSCLMIHDYTGPEGPIEQDRFVWCIGPQYDQELLDALRRDDYLAIPAVSLEDVLQRPELEQRSTEAIRQHARAQERVQEDVNRHYATVSRQSLIEAFSPNPSRPPRVLLITSRFTTVLQYATADAADAFRELGWQTRTVIEPSSSRDPTLTAIRNALLDFKPDLCFQIDHLRHEHRNVIPPQLPFACWIQDPLPNLNSAEAGAKVGVRDYVMSIHPVYTSQFAYPSRQMIRIHKLTRVPQRPASWHTDRRSMIYVSNASSAASDIAAQTVAEFKHAPLLAQLVESCCRRILEAYDAGQCLPTPHDVTLLIERCERETGLSIAHAAFRAELINTLFYRVSNVLYRQQSLRWAANVAKDLGLSLQIYGRGWENHPDFKPYARGPVAYGPQLEELTRSAMFTLKIEPYYCISHQRSLDALVAGGFLLIRDHLSNHVLINLCRFINEHLGWNVESVEQARSLLDGDSLQTFEEMLRQAEPIAEGSDAIDMVRRERDSGLIQESGEPLPHLAEITFNDEPGLRACAQRFLADPQRRDRIAEIQRKSIEERLSYRAGMAQLVGRIRELIAAEPAESPAAAA